MITLHMSATRLHPMSPADQIKLGTCAWNFEDWRDVFYPASLASNQELAYYARYLPAVEIDSTFYHIPRARRGRGLGRTHAG